MKPIVITSPFSGANHFCNVFVNLLTQWYGCNGYVHSLITPEFDKKVNIKYTDGIIEFISNGIRRDDFLTVDRTDTFSVFQATRVKNTYRQNIQLLLTSPNHLVKVYPFVDGMILNDSESIRCFTSELNYEILYFERRDKLHQLLSMLFISPQLPHITESKVLYQRHRAVQFIELLENLKLIKTELPARTIYYDDFLEGGSNEDTVIELLSLDKKEYVPAVYSNYNFVRLTEKNIINKDTWTQDRDEILSRLAALD